MFEFLFGHGSKREIRVMWIRLIVILMVIFLVGCCVVFEQARLGRMIFIAGFLTYIGLSIWQWIVRAEDLAATKQDKTLNTKYINKP
jgi:hypothetical protein